MSFSVVRPYFLYPYLYFLYQNYQFSLFFIPRSGFLDWSCLYPQVCILFVSLTGCDWAKMCGRLWPPCVSKNLCFACSKPGYSVRKVRNFEVIDHSFHAGSCLHIIWRIGEPYWKQILRDIIQRHFALNVIDSCSGCIVRHIGQLMRYTHDMCQVKSFSSDSENKYLIIPS